MDDIEMIMNAKEDFEDIKRGKKKLSKKLLMKYKKYIPEEVDKYINNLPKEGVDVNIPENMTTETIIKMASENKENREQKK